MICVKNIVSKFVSSTKSAWNWYVTGDEHETLFDILKRK